MLSGETQEVVEEDKKPAGPIKVTAAIARKPVKQAGKGISTVATADEEEEGDTLIRYINIHNNDHQKS